VHLDKAVIKAEAHKRPQTKPIIGETSHAGYEDVKPALGESWKVQANMRIALSCIGPVLRRASLAANTLGPCGACAYYELGEGGPRAVHAPP